MNMDRCWCPKCNVTYHGVVEKCEECGGDCESVDYVWCLHCERVFKVSEVSGIHNQSTECDGGPMDWWSWQSFKVDHPEYPDIPDLEAQYPLY